MYANLKGELAKNDITSTSVADFLGIHENTFCNKLNGRSRFTIEEAFAIKSKFFSDPQITLYYLFANVEANQPSIAS